MDLQEIGKKAFGLTAAPTSRPFSHNRCCCWTRLCQGSQATTM